MRIQPGYSEDTVRIQQGYSRGTVRVRQGYSQGTAGVQSGYSRGTVRVQQGYSQGTAGVQWGIVGTSRGTVVVGGRIYRESIKITQKIVNVFYIYCHIEARTSTIQTERICS